MKMKVDRARCTGCEICSFVCPAGAVMVTRKAEIDPKYCLDCGTCMVSCPNNAISMLEYPAVAIAS